MTADDRLKAIVDAANGILPFVVGHCGAYYKPEEADAAYQALQAAIEKAGGVTPCRTAGH